MDHSLLQPVAALMLLTLLVWVYMYLVRFRFIIANRVPAQSIATPELLNAALPERVNRPSNNLKNLFELPVIFYAVCILLLATQKADGVFLNLAWAYVGLRVVHSAIHCTVNIVALRFAVYALSSAVLWTMVLRLSLQVFHAASAS